MYLTMTFTRGANREGGSGTHNSAKHSISIVDPGVEDIVDDDEATLSSSERTATITAAMS